MNAIKKLIFFIDRWYVARRVERSVDSGQRLQRQINNDRTATAHHLHMQRQIRAGAARTESTVLGTGHECTQTGSVGATSVDGGRC